MIRKHDFLNIVFLLRSKSEDKEFYNSIEEDFSTKYSIISYIKKLKRRQQRIEESIKKSEKSNLFKIKRFSLFFDFIYNENTIR